MASSMYGLVRKVLLAVLMGSGPLVLADAATAGVTSSSCPVHSIAIAPGVSIQTVIERAGEGATLCLKNGLHRAQAVRPRSGQRFYGEGQTVLNGSALLSDFRREGRFWVASMRLYPRPKHGQCVATAPTCDQPEALFVDDRPLTKAATMDALTAGQFYIDFSSARIYVADDPANHKVEASIALFAFESKATDVLISNVTVEKFANGAQKGAIHAREGARWNIENCEVRLNGGAGISVGSGSRVRNCDIHRNGQIGISGNGTEIRIEDNRIWSNNIFGFDPAWEAGGVKIAESDRVTFRANHVHDNNGPGLWCDIDCRNVVYEGNLIENNGDIGIFHEISFSAVIRNNIVRHNGGSNRRWFWGADITLAASRNVEVSDNKLTTAAGGCSIVLIDQGRRNSKGKEYKTRDNAVLNNEMTFEGAACAGGASDTKPDDENFAIISEGNNRFDGNTYRVGRNSGRPRFVWGRDVTDWEGFRRKGLEQSGRLISF